MNLRLTVERYGLIYHFCGLCVLLGVTALVLMALNNPGTTDPVVIHAFSASRPAVVVVAVMMIVCGIAWRYVIRQSQSSA